MEFIQLPSFVQSADAACDRFDQAIRNIRADIPGTIETVVLNTVWAVTWAVTFAAAITFYAGQAAAEAWRARHHAVITAQICATPDADLDELVSPLLSQPIVVDCDLIDLGADAEDLAELSAVQLSSLCESRGVQQSRNGKHLPKSEMIAALLC